MVLPFIDPSQVPIVGAFLLVFAVVFGLLSLMKHEEKDKHGNVTKASQMFDKKVNAIIAVVFALFATTYEPLVLGLQEIMPYVVALLLGVFLIMFVKRLFSSSKSSDSYPLVVTIAVLLIILSTIGDSILPSLPLNLDRNQFIGAAGLILIVLIFYAVYRHEDKGGGAKQGE